jgi:hypothetical protein
MIMVQSCRLRVTLNLFIVLSMRLCEGEWERREGGAEFNGPPKKRETAEAVGKSSRPVPTPR